MCRARSQYFYFHVVYPRWPRRTDHTLTLSQPHQRVTSSQRLTSTTTTNLSPSHYDYTYTLPPNPTMSDPTPRRRPRRQNLFVKERLSPSIHPPPSPPPH